jgi:hypothetical protein
VARPSGTESDALSTALLTDPDLMTEFVTRRPEIRCAVVSGEGSAKAAQAHGIALRESF